MRREDVVDLQGEGGGDGALHRAVLSHPRGEVQGARKPGLGLPPTLAHCAVLVSML